MDVRSALGHDAASSAVSVGGLIFVICYLGGILVKRSLLALAILGASLSSAQAFTAGDWVLGRFQDGNYWFPGVVQSVKGSNIIVVYDDGDREVLNRRSVRPYDWKIGSQIECNYRGAGDWYAGKITSLGGENLAIIYEDGDKERTTTAFCRSR